MTDRIIASADFETDPFQYDRPVFPFCAELCISEDEYYQFWGEDCVEQLVEKIKSIDIPLLIYFHNGGRFDLFLGQPCLLHYIDPKLKIINRRIVSCHIGIHEIRDSFAVFPEALESFKGKHTKIKNFDYSKNEKEVRDIHRDEILNYMHLDCLTLLEHCQGFANEFGDNLTIGGTAMKELRKRHKFETFTGIDKKERDDYYRQFFFGGRTQCFKSGIIKGNYRIYDVNGMYQKVMRDTTHPLSQSFSIGRTIGPRTDFAIIEAENYGALPYRTKTGIDFGIEKGTFHTTIHEINAGLDTGTLKILRVLETRDCHDHGNFKEFIDHFYNQRQIMKSLKDGMRDSFYKRIMNAAYGKFAQNPEEYCDYTLTLGSSRQPEGDGWRECSRNGSWIIWERDSVKKQYLNVAIAASITGAARSILLRGLANAIDPVYCDTDSIICLGFRDGMNIHDNELGAWKQEGKLNPATGKFTYEADSIAIAGKKLYSVFDGDFSMKMACKGVRITPEQIRKIAQGDSVHFENPAPSFGFTGEQKFIARTVKNTAKAGRIRQLAS